MDEEKFDSKYYDNSRFPSSASKNYESKHYDNRRFPPVFWIGAFVMLAFWLWEIGFWKDDLEPIKQHKHDFRGGHSAIPTEKAGN